MEIKLLLNIKCSVVDWPTFLFIVVHIMGQEKKKTGQWDSVDALIFNLRKRHPDYNI